MNKQQGNTKEVKQRIQQARDYLEGVGLAVSQTQAYELAARFWGYSNKHALAAALPKYAQNDLCFLSNDWTAKAAAMVATLAAAPKQLPPLAVMGPADGDLYEGRVTVDMTYSADIRVRAHSLEAAQELLREAGHKQYPQNFELDEGNYRGPCDFYLGDPDKVENLSKVVLDVQFNHDGNYFGSAKWTEGDLDYSIEMSRNNPDSSPDGGEDDEDEDEDEDEGEEDWSAVTVTLRVSDKAGLTSLQILDEYEVHSDNLAEWIAECIENDDFDENFEKITAELQEFQKALKL